VEGWGEKTSGLTRAAYPEERLNSKSICKFFQKERALFSNVLADMQQTTYPFWVDEKLMQAKKCRICGQRERRII
jgi:hypothetical protein